MKKIVILFTAIACLVACTNKPAEGTVEVSTIDNLKTAITGETNASAKYALLSEEAFKQGQLGIAAMFEAASVAENIHVQSHTAVLNEMGEGIDVVIDVQISEDMEENIQYAIEGETYEFTEMYPPMIEQANKENLTDALRTFTYAKKAEENHAKLYEEALELLKAGKSEEIAKIWYVCPLCGNLYNTIEGFELCAICGAGKTTFLHFEK